MLPAKTTVFFHFDSIRIILLILHSIVISLFAFTTCQCDLYSHGMHLLKFFRIVLLKLLSISSKKCAQKKEPLASIKILTQVILNVKSNFKKISIIFRKDVSICITAPTNDFTTVSETNKNPNPHPPPAACLQSSAEYQPSSH